VVRELASCVPNRLQTPRHIAGLRSARRATDSLN